MKKITLVLLMIFLLIQVLSTVSIIHAADMISGAMPGINCGVGGTGEENEKCCYNEPVRMPRFFEWGKGKPVIGKMIKPLTDKFDALEELGKNQPEACIVGVPSTDASDRNCKCLAVASSSAVLSIHKMCTQYIQGTSELKHCHQCVNDGGIYTGIGCVPLNIQEFIGSYIFSWGIGFAGGIALLCIIYSAFRMQTSMGNPEAIKKAQENLTACITGLILIIFSVFILRLIGVSILKIPFLSGSTTSSASSIPRCQEYCENNNYYACNSDGTTALGINCNSQQCRCNPLTGKCGCEANVTPTIYLPLPPLSTPVPTIAPTSIPGVCTETICEAACATLSQESFNDPNRKVWNKDGLWYDNNTCFGSPHILDDGWCLCGN